MALAMGHLSSYSPTHAVMVLEMDAEMALDVVAELASEMVLDMDAVGGASTIPPTKPSLSTMSSPMNLFLPMNSPPTSSHPHVRGWPRIDLGRLQASDQGTDTKTGSWCASSVLVSHAVNS